MTVQSCYRCDKTTNEPTTVGEIHSASGPGRTIWACPQCAPHATAATTPAAALANSLRRGVLTRAP